MKSHLILLTGLWVIYLSTAEKVAVDVYMESRCPDTDRFIKEQLKPAMEGPLGNHFAVDLHIFGKAKCVGQDEFSDGCRLHCQHTDECKMNKLMLCAEKRLLSRGDSMKKVIEVIKCLMLKKITEWKAMSCLQAAHLDSKDVRECALGNEGDKMHYRDGRETTDLANANNQKRLDYVPSIAMNGERKCSRGNCKSFAKQLCEVIAQGERPEMCDGSEEK